MCTGLAQMRGHVGSAAGLLIGYSFRIIPKRRMKVGSASMVIGRKFNIKDKVLGVTDIRRIAEVFYQAYSEFPRRAALLGRPKAPQVLAGVDRRRCVLG